MIDVVMEMVCTVAAKHKNKHFGIFGVKFECLFCFAEAKRKYDVFKINK